VDVSRIPPGRKPPEEINVLIEVPLRADPIEYEFDKETGAIFVDRYLYTTMFHPCNYGFVPNTLAEDGDPVDVMVVGRMPPLPGAVLRVRPIGVLGMEDEAGMDEKILGVPIARITPVYSNVLTYRDLPELDLARIPHRPFLRALQGPRARQVGPGDRLGGSGAAPRADRGGDRACRGGGAWHMSPAAAPVPDPVGHHRTRPIDGQERSR
jgi:inorganic pyrophosphatase